MTFNVFSHSLRLLFCSLFHSQRATRKLYSAEEKIEIVSNGLRGEDSIAELCRRQGISQGMLKMVKGLHGLW